MDVDRFSWSRMSNNIVPNGRSCHTAEICGNEIYLFGGGLKTRYADLWKYSLVTNTWTEVYQKGQAQPPRNFHSSVMCNEYIVLFGGNLNQENNQRSNDTLVFRLMDYIPIYKSSILQLEAWLTTPGIHSDTRLVFEDGELYSQLAILKYRVPVLHHFIESINSGSSNISYLLRIPCDLHIGKALSTYIYRDELERDLDLISYLNLYSLACKYAISPLMNKIFLYLYTNISHSNAVQIANYLSLNSIGGILNRNELRENRYLFYHHNKNPEISIVVADEREEKNTERLYKACISYIFEFIDDLQRRSIFIPGKIENVVNIDVKNLAEKPKTKIKRLKPENRLQVMGDTLNCSLEMLYNDESKDITLVTEGNEIKAHTYMLITGSLFFRSLITNPFAESRENRITIDDVDISALEPLIKYIYLGPTGIKDLSPEDQSQLVPWADYLQLTNPELRDMIGASIHDILTQENIFEYLEMSHQMQAAVMMKMIMEFFMEHYSALVEREEMNSLPIGVLVELHRWRAKIEK